MIQGHTVIHDEFAERCVAGAVVGDPQLANEIGEIVTRIDFGFPSCAALIEIAPQLPVSGELPKISVSHAEWVERWAEMSQDERERLIRTPTLLQKRCAVASQRCGLPYGDVFKMANERPSRRSVLDDARWIASLGERRRAAIELEAMAKQVLEGLDIDQVRSVRQQLRQAS